jgi:hypothetical protein
VSTADDSQERLQLQAVSFGRTIDSWLIQPFDVVPGFTRPAGEKIETQAKV